METSGSDLNDSMEPSMKTLRGGGGGGGGGHRGGARTRARGGGGAGSAVDCFGGTAGTRARGVGVESLARSRQKRLAIGLCSGLLTVGH